MDKNKREVLDRAPAIEPIPYVKMQGSTEHAEFLESYKGPVTCAPAIADHPGTDSAAFKNFHRSLCARFGYNHDEQFWWRDLVSLEEHIAARAQPVSDAQIAKDRSDAIRYRYFIEQSAQPVTAGELPKLPKANRLSGPNLDSLHALYTTEQMRATSPGLALKAYLPLAASAVPQPLQAGRSAQECRERPIRPAHPSQRHVYR